jgi:hypothetical protein
MGRIFKQWGWREAALRSRVVIRARTAPRGLEAAGVDEATDRTCDALAVAAPVEREQVQPVADGVAEAESATAMVEKQGMLGSGFVVAASDMSETTIAEALQPGADRDLAASTGRLLGETGLQQADAESVGHDAPLPAAAPPGTDDGGLAQRALAASGGEEPVVAAAEEAEPGEHEVLGGVLGGTGPEGPVGSLPRVALERAAGPDAPRDAPLALFTDFIGVLHKPGMTRSLLGHPSTHRVERVERAAGPGASEAPWVQTIGRHARSVQPRWTWIPLRPP